MIKIKAKLKQLEKSAIEQKIPIMEKDGIRFLVNYIKQNKVKQILEIGSAVGYSAINMALVADNINITTIEINEERYLEALKNIKNFDLDKRIELVLGDALELKIEQKYDLIFIDAAKGKYIDYFLKYMDNLTEVGCIITDNIYFHGLVGQKELNVEPRIERLVEKITEYIKFLKDHPDFETTFYQVGDGLSVSKKRVKADD